MSTRGPLFQWYNNVNRNTFEVNICTLLELVNVIFPIKLSFVGFCSTSYTYINSERLYLLHCSCRPNTSQPVVRETTCIKNVISICVKVSDMSTRGPLFQWYNNVNRNTFEVYLTQSNRTNLNSNYHFLVKLESYFLAQWWLMSYYISFKR
jgi:hypothetical protein